MPLTLTEWDERFRQQAAWTRDLRYHPHVHFLVPGGGLAADQQAWLPSREEFLVHVRPLSVLFRAKFREAFRQTDMFDQAPIDVWQQDWVVHCKSVGNGQATLKYLAPYIFRVAISNNSCCTILKGLNNIIVPICFKSFNSNKKAAWVYII